MKIKLKEKYLIFLIILCFVSVSFYYSYAIFITKQLQENVVMVKIDNKSVTVKVDGNDNRVNVLKNSIKDVKISLNNEKETNYHYVVLVKGLVSGVKVSSNDLINGEIVNNSNELTVHINNTTNEDIQLEFIVKLGNNDNIDKTIGYSYINQIDSFDHSQANKPEINSLNLIPVSYKKISDTEGYWYKTDINNQIDLWYSYENGVWANAVLLDNNNYNKYKNKSIGERIEIEDTLGFYVWIPKFKYYIVNSVNYTNYERISNIIFENGNESTGTVNCIDKISNLSDKHIYSEVCTDNFYDRIYDNLSTYTHPAFRNNNGFWVSKFLMGESEKSLPNTNILKKNINDANTISNKYKSHILTNMEYGAIMLLSNSMYGKTANTMYIDKDNSTFTRIYANTYEYGVTGCSSGYSMHSKGINNEVTKECIPYNDLTNYSHVSNSISYPIGYVGAGASTTGTINGVYDLASITGEIVAGFVADTSGTVNTDIKYYDVYSYNEYVGKISSSSSIYNLYRYKLGDGIREHYRSFSEYGMWHNGMLVQNSDTGIIVRGANNSAYSMSIENITLEAPFRLVLN